MIVLSSIIIGVIILLLNDAFGNGMINQMLNNQIKSHTSHLQIHKRGFNDNKVVKSYIEDAGMIEEAIKKEDFVKHYSKRIVLYGLANYASSSAGVTFVGIEPDREENMTVIKKSLIKGDYLSGAPNEIVIGQKLSEKLDVELGNPIVIRATRVEGMVGMDVFTVVGIYKTGTADFDKMHVYIPLSSAQSMLGLEGKINEFAILTKEPENFAEYESILNAKINPGHDEKIAKYEVLSYPKLLPFLYNYIKMYDEMIYFFYLIIGVAVMFGTINTMLMSVFERVHELGVLMSIGMKNSKIFMMVLQEAFVLGTFGAIIGFILGYLIYLPLASSGIDFSIYSESLSTFGTGNIIYPELKSGIIIKSLLIMPFVTVAGAIYPAIKAIKLQPTEAMRHV